MAYTYPITIHHLYRSPGHNYFTHSYDAPAAHPTIDAAQVALHADQGIVGDRFYGRGANFDGHVTFFAWEVYQLLQATYPHLIPSPAALRRNVIVEGVPLNQLIGQAFTIDGTQFRGTKHCAPCRWLDVAVADGTLALLKGRGGLRAQVLSDGTLQRGTAVLSTSVALDLTALTEPLPRPRLP